jgi:hypothetical protein
VFYSCTIILTHPTPLRPTPTTLTTTLTPIHVIAPSIHSHTYFYYSTYTMTAQY